MRITPALLLLITLALASCDTVGTYQHDDAAALSKSGGTVLVCHVGSTLPEYDPTCDPETQTCGDAGRIRLLSLPESAAAMHVGNPSHSYNGVSDYYPSGKGASGEGKTDTDGNGIDEGCEIPDQETFTNSIGMQFKSIPKGTFLMGSALGADELPVHSVTLTRDFYIGIYEVTQEEWMALKGTDPSYFPDCPKEVDDNCPVEWVSWYDIIGYANALSVAEGLAPCYDETTGNVVDPAADGDVYQCRGYRLPTEAEWEYATRAGTTTEYSFGEDYPPTSLGNYAWYNENSAVNGVMSTHPVGGKLANPWGLYDVHGNVWEWVHDWYSSIYYSASPSTDPQGPASGSFRVLRGGGWGAIAFGLRSAEREYSYTGFRSEYVGFRLSRTIF